MNPLETEFANLFAAVREKSEENARLLEEDDEHQQWVETYMQELELSSPKPDANQIINGMIDDITKVEGKDD